MVKAKATTRLKSHTSIMEPTCIYKKTYATRNRSNRGRDHNVVQRDHGPQSPPLPLRSKFAKFTKHRSGINHNRTDLKNMNDGVKEPLEKSCSEPIINVEMAYLTLQNKYSLTLHKDQQEAVNDVIMNAKVIEQFKAFNKIARRLIFRDEVLNEGLVNRDCTTPSLIDIKTTTEEERFEVISAELVNGDCSTPTLLDVEETTMECEDKEDVQVPEEPIIIEDKIVAEKLSDDKIITKEPSEDKIVTEKPSEEKITSEECEVKEAAISATVTTSSDAQFEPEPDTATVSSTTSTPERPNETVESSSIELVESPTPMDLEADTLIRQAEPNASIVVEEKSPKTSPTVVTTSDSPSRRKTKPGSRLLPIATQCPQPKAVTDQITEETERPATPKPIPLDPSISLIALDGSSAGQVVKTFSSPTKRKIETSGNSPTSPDGKFLKIVSVTGGTQLVSNSPTSTRVEQPSQTTTASELYRRSLPSSSTRPSQISSTTDPRPNSISRGNGGMTTVLPAIPKDFRSKIIKTEILEPEDADFPKIEQVFCNSGNNNNSMRIVNGGQLKSVQDKPTGRTALSLDSVTARIITTSSASPGLPRKQYRMVPMNQLAQHGLRIQGGKLITSGIQGGKLITSGSLVRDSAGNLSLVRPASYTSTSASNSPSSGIPGVKTYSVNPIRQQTPLPLTPQMIPAKKLSFSGANLIVCPPPTGSPASTQSEQMNVNSINQQIKDVADRDHCLKLKEHAIAAERAKYPEIRLIKGHELMCCRICAQQFRKGAPKLYRLHMLREHEIDLSDRYPLDDEADSDEEDELEDEVSTWYKCKKCKLLMQGDKAEPHRVRCHIDEDGNCEVIPYDTIDVDLMKMKKNLPSQRIPCGLCENRHFDTSSSFRIHMANEHPDVAPKILMVPALRCGSCMLKFDNTGVLTQHAARCQSRPLDETILELADKLRSCEVCSEVHKTIEDTAQCYKEMGIDRCMICSFGKSIRKNFTAHMSRYHSGCVQGNTCPFCVMDQHKQFVSVKVLFQHIIYSHYTPALQRREKNKRAMSTAQAQYNNGRPNINTASPRRSPETSVPSVVDDIRYQAVLQSKRPLRPKLADVVTISPVTPQMIRRVYPPIVPSAIINPTLRTSTLVTPAITISPILSSGPASAPLVSSTTGTRSNITNSPSTFGDSTITQVDLNSILGIGN